MNFQCVASPLSGPLQHFDFDKISVGEHKPVKLNFLDFSDSVSPKEKNDLFCKCLLQRGFLLLILHTKHKAKESLRKYKYLYILKCRSRVLRLFKTRYLRGRWYKPTTKPRQGGLHIGKYWPKAGSVKRVYTRADQSTQLVDKRVGPTSWFFS